MQAGWRQGVTAETGAYSQDTKVWLSILHILTRNLDFIRYITLIMFICTARNQVFSYEKSNKVIGKEDCVQAAGFQVEEL